MKPIYTSVGIKPQGVQPAPATPAGDFEINSVAVPVVTRAGIGSTMSPLVVLSTAAPWKGIDVALDTSQFTPRTGSIFWAAVYARSAAGANLLVATGRVNLSQVPKGQRLICSARAAKAIFDVHLGYHDEIGLALGGAESVNVSMVASDTEGPAIPSAGIAYSNGVLNVGVKQNPIVELLGFSASNDTAAAKYIQLHNGAPGLGQVPQLEWALPATIGASIVVPDLRYRAGYSINLLPSSTQGTYTADTAIVSAWYR